MTNKHYINNFILVTSQEELDQVPHDSEDIIVIKFGTYVQPAEIHDRVNVVVTGNYCVKAYGNSSIIANNGCDLELYGSSKAKVFMDCGVVAHDNSTVEAFDIYSNVKAFDNSLVRTIETPVYLHDKSKVIVYGDRPCEVHHEFDDDDLPY